MRPRYLREQYSNAAVVTATLTALTAKNSATRSYDRWIYGVIPGGGADMQYLQVKCDGVFPGNATVTVQPTRLGTVHGEPVIFPRALYIPANNSVVINAYQDSGGNQQENIDVLYTRDAPPANIPVGYIYGLAQAVTAADESLGGGTAVTLPDYGRGKSVTHELLRMGGCGAGAVVLAVGLASDALETANYTGEAHIHAPGAADVNVGPNLWPPSEPVTFHGGDIITPKAMDISAGAVATNFWFGIGGI